MATTYGVYIHIPFCKSKCDYCDFYSLAGREEEMDHYQKALIAQLRSFAPRLKGRVADTIYFGGGTPSYYGEKRLRELLVLIQRVFTVSRQAEITVECNPDSVDWRSIARLRRAGVNRISLGAQTADPQQLRCLHRIHSTRQVVQAVADIRRAKITNLSLDLIYGLPDQDMASWLDTLNKAIALAPEHLSCYGLKVEEGTPLARRVAEGSFRRDLFYRLNVIRIHIPPLRERGEDIQLLANHFLRTYARKYKKDIRQIARDARGKLQRYAWPGNVRELQHAIERAVVLCNADTLHADDFLLHAPASPVTDGETLNLEALERNAVEKAVRLCEGNMSRAAQMLGITRYSLYRKLEKLGL